MKNVLFKVKRKLGLLSNEDFINNLVSRGATIGHKVKFFSPSETVVDMTRPWLISIGSYTKITRGVIILAHDYSLSVLRRVYGEWIGEGQETVIGENCFIGMNAIILMGSHIGNNCIVGAGSVVHGEFPDNVVIAGNPAYVICSLEQHCNNRKMRTVNEAKQVALKYVERYGKLPIPGDMGGFKFLFAPRSMEKLLQYKLNFYCNGDEPEEVEKAFFDSIPYWNDFDSFLCDALDMDVHEMKERYKK